ncbi:MAG: desulfoferrodoxin family protein, partial [Lachnospiraceae bacterium]
FICRHCGNMMTLVHDAGVPVECCGEPMEELVANTVEASAEKHIPFITQEGSLVKVQVGEVEHPMVAAHFIQWICLETNQGTQIKYLNAGEKPYAEFSLLPGETVDAVYEYCNVHGLWKKEM